MNNIKKSRVHPLVIIDTLIKGLKLNGILILLALKEQNWKLNLLIFAGILLLIAIGIFDYFLKSYEVRDGAFIYTTGIINKKVKNINLENIQSIDTSSNILYQSFDLLSVDINLVGDNIKIKPLKKDVALFLIEILNKIRKSEECTFLEEEKVEIAQKEILKLSVKDLAFYGLLRVRFFAALGLILAFNDKIRDVFKYILGNEAYFDKLLQENAKSVIGDIKVFILTIGIFMLLVVTASIIHTIVKYYNFILTTKENNLLCKYGLLNKKSLIIDIDRIQSVKLIYPLRYRFFGLAKLSVETLTNDVSDDLSEKKSTIDVLPLVKNDFARNFVKNNLSIDLEYYANVEGEKIQSKARIAMYRWSLFNCSFLPLIAFAILYFAKIELKLEYIILGLFAFYFILVFYSILVKNYMLKYNELSYDRYYFKNTFMRQLTIITELIKVKKVGTINSRTNYFMNKRDLAHLSINSIGVNSDINLRYYDKGYKEKLERDFIILEVGCE
ncbi:PH domain-containing protein [Gemella sanguinis]|jgi:bacterial membrane flanked domain protein|uniref:PH domain-containing protein n=1 Tax=Gemella sanguinis TaxID=84135 RepID=UPI0028E5021E|nr:PH domain-containing protein [Gemella sanguinis]